MNRLLTIVCSALTASLLALAPVKAANQDIVDIAAGAGTFNTLVAAVKAADLVGQLKSPGPFTVFAPTDEAFAKLPAGTVESLLKPDAEGTPRAARRGEPLLDVDHVSKAFTIRKAGVRIIGAGRRRCGRAGSVRARACTTPSRIT